MDLIQDVRGRVAGENLQEIMDAATSAKHGLKTGQQQYQTPEWLARPLAQLLPTSYYDNVVDPQCAAGHLVNAVSAPHRFGTELDRRFAGGEGSNYSGSLKRITGNCVKIWETMDELYPDIRFACMVANPPFAIRWKVTDPAAAGVEITMDSTEWTWKTIKQRLAINGGGFLISNANTLERMGITEDPWVYLYQRFPKGGIWENTDVEIGIVHFANIRDPFDDKKEYPQRKVKKVWGHVPGDAELLRLRSEILHVKNYSRPYQFGALHMAWVQLTNVVIEESRTRPKYNIYLNDDGMLKTYLSTRLRIKVKHDEIEKLARINNCHPLTLTTERETRKLLHSYLTAGVYTIEPKAREAITAALHAVASLACPIRPITDFETVAYADEEDSLKCRATDARGRVRLTVGRSYEVKTGTYTFKETFSRQKIHFNVETGVTTVRDHDCQLSGEDRYIEITDDRGHLHRFMDRPENSVYQHSEELLWQLFQKPYVPSVAEVHSAEYEKHLSAMRFNEMMAGFKYFPGQLDYYARMACKDYGLVAADVGTGKSVGALTLIALKSPKRTLLIAPQGTMRSVGDEEEVDYEASQWVSEIKKFAPTEPVFQLFSREDWQSILHANGGQLPQGIYITYRQAYFQNGGFEHLPESWEPLEEKKFCERFGLKYDKERPIDECFHRNVGASNKKGIRCIAEPTLATLMTAHHGDPWEMVIIDEAHLCCNLDAQITKKLLRLQPKYRFAMTATPIPNVVSNIFSLMGWLCVPNWYKGNTRNAAWPYAVEEIGRFNSTFLSVEEDLTQQEEAKARGSKGWRRSGTKHSPIISSPARLLKLLKPNLAYIQGGLQPEPESVQGH